MTPPAPTPAARDAMPPGAGAPAGPRAPSFGVLALLAAVLWLLYQLRAVLLVLVASLFLAYVLDPLVDRLEAVGPRRGRTLGRKGAAAVVVLLAVALIVQGLAWFVPMLWGEFARLGGELPGYYAQAETWLARMAAERGFGLPPEFWQAVQEQWHGLITRGAGVLGQKLPDLLGSLGSVLGVLVVPIGAFYILSDGRALTRHFVLGLPSPWRPTARRLMEQADRSLATYVRGQTLVVLVAGTIASIVFSLVGVRYALALGVLAGLAEAVPYLGAFAVVSSLALVTFEQGAGFLLLALGAYVALNQVNNYLITPRLMGSRLNLHPFIVILAVLAGGSLGGILGTVLALPTAALLVGLGGALWGAGRPEDEPS